MIYMKYIKKPLDLILAFLALILLSPLFVIISICIGLSLGRPVIFKQERLGLNHKAFVLYKFRTMKDKRDLSGMLLPNNLRLTHLGQFLRSASLDELPELWNIIRGDMSFVGPRPLLVEYLPFYNAHQKRRHEALPGLTGLAQVNGRNSISWEKRLNLDVDYIDHISLLGDMKIIMMTIKQVILRRDIYSKSGLFMKKFSDDCLEGNSESQLCKDIMKG